MNFAAIFYIVNAISEPSIFYPFKAERDLKVTFPERDLKCNDILPVLWKFLLPMFS